VLALARSLTRTEVEDEQEATLILLGALTPAALTAFLIQSSSNSIAFSDKDER
jgi:hypothetical protein